MGRVGEEAAGVDVRVQRHVGHRHHHVPLARVGGGVHGGAAAADGAHARHVEPAAARGEAEGEGVISERREEERSRAEPRQPLRHLPTHPHGVKRRPSGMPRRSRTRPRTFRPTPPGDTSSLPPTEVPGCRRVPGAGDATKSATVPPTTATEAASSAASAPAAPAASGV